MLKSIFWLSILATPLLAQPISSDSLAKRDSTTILNIYIDSTIFPDTEALKQVHLSLNNPLGTELIPLTLPTSNDTAPHETFSRILEETSLTETVDAALMTTVTLRADGGTRTFSAVGLGEGLDLNCNITLKQEPETGTIKYILVWGLEVADGKEAPGSDVLLIECDKLN